MNKREQHIVGGMSQDLSVHRFTPNLVKDARNIRITARDGVPSVSEEGSTPQVGEESLLSVTNEKGTSYLSLTGDSLKGTLLGHASFKNILVLFTKDTNTHTDYIYKMVFNDAFDSAHVTKLFSSTNLGFRIDKPIETLAVYENDDIKKVYWTDGENQPRLINIERVYSSSDSFNFVREFETVHQFFVKKQNTGGEFPTGMIQYCFTYFNKYGQETAVVDVTPEYYLSPQERGLPADASDSSSFILKLIGLDSRFEYVRIYSIIRTSEGTTPAVRIVGDYAIKMNIEFTNVMDDDKHPNLVDLYYRDHVGRMTRLTEWEGWENRIEIGEYDGQPLYNLELEGGYIVDINGGDNVRVCVNYQRYQETHNINLSRSSNFAVAYTDEASVLTIPVTQPDSLTVLEGEITDNNSILLVDNGTHGTAVASTLLYFLGGNMFKAGTFAAKDNTMFLGNIENVTVPVGNLFVNTGASTRKKLKEALRNLTVTSEWFNGKGLVQRTTRSTTNPYTVSDEILSEGVSTDGFYDYPIDNNQSDANAKGFQKGENYRLGLIFQDKKGKWSEAVWLGDYTEEKRASKMAFADVLNVSTHNKTTEYRPFNVKAGFAVNLNSYIVDSLLAAGYQRVAPVVVFPNRAERIVACQGILAGTAFNVSDRNDDSPYVQADWRFRMGYSWGVISDEIQCAPDIGYYLEEDSDVTETGLTVKGNPRDYVRPDYPAYYVDITEQGEGGTTTTIRSSAGGESFGDCFGEYYYRDAQILTLHSPEVEFEENIGISDFANCNMRIVGISNLGYMDSEGSSKVPYYPKRAIGGFVKADTEGFADYATVLEMPSGWSSVNLEDVNSSSSSYSFSSSSSSATTRTSGAGRYNTTKWPDALAFPGYRDTAVVHEDVDGKKVAVSFRPYGFDWVTYLWHRNGSLNSQMALTTVDQQEGIRRTALLGHKIVSELKYARTVYIPNEVEVYIEKPVLFDSDQNTMVKVKFDGKDVTYYGNIDKVQSPNFVDIISTKGGVDVLTGKTYKGINKEWGYPIEAYAAGTVYEGPRTRASTETHDTRMLMFRYHQNMDPGKDPVLIRYKTTKHLVIPLKASTDNTFVHIGEHGTDANGCFADGQSSRFLFWTDGYYYGRHQRGTPGWTPPPEETFKYVGLTNSNLPTNYTVGKSVYIVELYRNFSEAEFASRFGGTTEKAMAENTWQICGDAINLHNASSYNGVDVNFTDGDTYLARYDCLKSYPYAEGDPNSIVSIYSTEVETRVNLDLRCDKNRGLVDNTLVTPRNFNVFNREGYERKTTYFNYRGLDYEKFTVEQYPNMITWSLEKVMGEKIDTWTHIPLTSTLDLDGTKGEITALVNYNNEIFAFQRSSVTQVLFNSRVQIPVSDGQPIEITNGMKVSGIRVLSPNVGTTNKWSICTTPKGLYFVDNEKGNIYAFTQSLQDLSTAKGFKSWMLQHTELLPWTPELWNNIRTYYDKLNEDLYFMTKDESLVYSETLGNFTSFMSYKKAIMTNVGSKFIAFTTNEVERTPYTPSLLNTSAVVADEPEEEGSAIQAASQYETVLIPWEMWGGDYNRIFGQFEPYSITFVSNADPTYDKVFNNLEWRSAVYANGTYQPHKTFNRMRIWHEYQDTGLQTVSHVAYAPSVMKKKFNAFRVQIPRDKNHWMDRIRNTWAYVKLEQTADGNTDFMRFSDLCIDYFI